MFNIYAHSRRLDERAETRRLAAHEAHWHRTHACNFTRCDCSESGGPRQQARGPRQQLHHEDVSKGAAPDASKRLFSILGCRWIRESAIQICHVPKRAGTDRCICARGHKKCRNRRGGHVCSTRSLSHPNRGSVNTIPSLISAQRSGSGRELMRKEWWTS